MELGLRHYYMLESPGPADAALEGLDFENAVRGMCFNRGPSVNVTARRVEGAGEVAFGDPNRARTTARFSTPGEYELELSGPDTEGSSEVKVKILIS